MKKIIIMLLAGLLAQQITMAQGTVYLSNLGQTPTGSSPVGSDSWLAAGFETGNNAGGYLLDSIQLEMTDASGSPNNFTVMLYNAVFGVAVNPGSSLGTLDGSADPATDNIYTYTDDSNLTLSPGTDYFIVLLAGTTIANGAYAWSLAGANSYNPSDGFRGIGFYASGDGSSWYNPSVPSGPYPQFAITATPIPEPSPALLLLLGSGALIYVRRTFHH